MSIADHIYHDHTSLDYTRILQILLVFAVYFYLRAPSTTINYLSLGYVVLCTHLWI